MCECVCSNRGQSAGVWFTCQLSRNGRDSEEEASGQVHVVDHETAVPLRLSLDVCKHLHVMYI